LRQARRDGSEQRRELVGGQLGNRAYKVGCRHATNPIHALRQPRLRAQRRANRARENTRPSPVRLS
jgi:hypothetical protein